MLSETQDSVSAVKKKKRVKYAIKKYLQQTITLIKSSTSAGDIYCIEPIKELF